MLSKSKKFVLATISSVLLLASLGSNTVWADTTDDTNISTQVTVTNGDNSVNTSTSASQKSDASSSAISTTPSYNDIDVTAVKMALLNELNRLRAQNGLNPLTPVNVLNNYAQERTDSFTSSGVDNHSGWHSISMYPYNYTAEENISQMPFGMIGTTDPDAIAKKITGEFYNEKYDSNPNYGHRKNMLNPYINYVGIGLTISNYGMVYVSQEMGNDQASYSKYDPKDLNDYYLTNENDYANASQYDIADDSKTGADYIKRDDYQTVDVRGGVSTKNYPTPLYDRYANQRTDLELSPNSDWIADIIATINGKNYYHVSDNGFVAAVDALPWASFLYGTRATALTNARVYDNNGNYTGQKVIAGSKWITDRRATNPITDVKMYRIGTNAWIQKDQARLY